MNLKQMARIMRRYLHGVYVSSKMLQDGILISGDISPVLSKLGFHNFCANESLFVNGSLVAEWSHNRLQFQEKSCLNIVSTLKMSKK